MIEEREHEKKEMSEKITFLKFKFQLTHLAVFGVQTFCLIFSLAITDRKQSNAAETVRNTLRLCAVNPKGNITGAERAKYLETKADLFLILSKKNKKKEVEMMVASEKARAKR